MGLPPEMVKKCLSRMSGKLSRTVLKQGKGSNPFSLVDYCSKDYQALLAKYKMRCSMSRKGNCYDNASAESFFGTIKNELIYLHKFKTRLQARDAIFDYIEVFYNRKRSHQSLNYMTPAAYLNQHLGKTIEKHRRTQF